MKKEVSPLVIAIAAVCLVTLIAYMSYRTFAPPPPDHSGPTTQEMMAKMKGPQGQKLSVPKMKGQP